MKNIILLGFALFALASCSNFLEDYSQDEAKVENIADLDELLIGSVYYKPGCVYFKGSSSEQIGEPFLACIHFMSDELKQNEDRYGHYEMLSGTEEMFGYYTWQKWVGMDFKGTRISKEGTDWTKAYKYINVANMILDEVEDIKVDRSREENDKLRVEGETRFLRALYYFLLVNLYAEPYVPATAATTAGVPLKLTAYIEDKEYTSATLEEVYAQILEDLGRAEECLKQCERKSVYRADYATTLLLKSRVYLYMQDYAKAKEYAGKVIERNASLTDLHGYAAGTANVYSAESPEVLFSMGGHFLSNYMYGDFDPRYEDQTPFFVSDELAEAFSDDNDLRKSLYVVEGEYGYFYKKIYWDINTQKAPSKISDHFLFRVSEAYLNLAEAAALDDDEATARDILGKLQAKRYNTMPAINESGSDLIDLIRAERRRELCLEGHRWFDLRRYMVCEKHKSQMKITHTYTDYELSGYRWTATRVRVFELDPENNPQDFKAYTLAFPKEVLDFQNTLGRNERPDRLPINN
ncbi:MAG: RagB/SusD family nutrient uptake outer membrane protein [Odoribacter sp.]|nr:RagB/SusD family nutrient uptake outer membrane protein [Odoribacter sp.]